MLQPTLHFVSNCHPMLSVCVTSKTFTNSALASNVRTYLIA